MNVGSVHKISGAIGEVSANESRGAGVFLCGKPDNFLATFQRSIFTKFVHEMRISVPQRISKDIFEHLLFAPSPQQTSNLKGVKQAPHSEQPTAHGMHCICREIAYYL